MFPLITVSDLSAGYLVFAERHHALVGRIRSSKDVRRVVSSLHAVVQLRELRQHRSIHKELIYSN